MFNRLIPLLVSLIGYVMLTGCVNYLRYPAWGPVEESQNIELTVEGSYLCEGEILESNMGLWQEKHLGQYLFPGSPSLSCDFISLQRIGNDTLMVFAVRQGTRVDQRLLAKGKDYEIDREWLRIRSHPEKAAEDIVAAWGSVSNSLTLDKNGNLIVQSKKFTVGVALIIPGFTAGQSWARFKRTTH